MSKNAHCSFAILAFGLTSSFYPFALFRACFAVGRRGEQRRVFRGQKIYYRRSAQGDFAGNPPSPSFGVACRTAAIVTCHRRRGNSRVSSREFPHNRFRVAPMGEAAASDMASVSGLVSALLLLPASPLE